MEQLFTLTKMVAALVGMSLLVLGGQYATGKVRGIRVGDDQPVMTGAAPTVGETGDTTAGSTGEGDFTIDSFEECAQAGFPVLQTYPPICRTPDGRTFVEGIDVPLPSPPAPGEPDPCPWPGRVHLDNPDICLVTDPSGVPVSSSTPNGWSAIDDFEECIQAGFPVLQTYPRICKTPDGRTFVEEVTPPVDPPAPFPGAPGSVPPSDPGGVQPCLVGSYPFCPDVEPPVVVPTPPADETPPSFIPPVPPSDGTSLCPWSRFPNICLLY